MKLLLLCLCVAFTQGGLAPLYLAKERAIPDRFNIKIKDASLVDQVAKEIEDIFSKMRTTIGRVNKIRLVIPALTLRIPPLLVDDIRALDAIEYMEQDSLGVMTTSQYNPAWGLDRLDSRNGLDGVYNYNANVQGQGVNVYVLDSGVQINHSIFGGRAQQLFGGLDDHGHGTHCAGIAAGDTYGIARKATILGVKICAKNGYCPNSVIIKAFDSVLEHGKTSKGIISISLRFSASQLIDDCVQKVWDDGFTVAVAAANENTDACFTSPQRVHDTLTVGATNKNDVRASFSNYGTCVDIFAPGVSIVSAKWSETSIDGTTTKSGTSMACPFVAGAAALYFGLHPTSSPQQVKNELLNAATKDVVIDPKGTPNRLLYVKYN